jgi:hypothetical protein
MVVVVEVEAIADRLSPRLHNCLRNEGIKTLDELSERTAAELLRLPNFGPRQLNELRKVLAECGRAFAGEAAPLNPVPQVAAKTGIPEDQLRRLRSMYERTRRFQQKHIALEIETGQRLQRSKQRLERSENVGAALLAEIEGRVVDDWKAKVEELGLVETSPPAP